MRMGPGVDQPVIDDCFTHIIEQPLQAEVYKKCTTHIVPLLHGIVQKFTGRVRNIIWCMVVL